MSSEPKGHIVAMGGGGFSMEPDHRLLDDFVLSLARRQPASVCFVPTAMHQATLLAHLYVVLVWLREYVRNRFDEHQKAKMRDGLARRYDWSAGVSQRDPVTGSGPT